MMLITIIVLSVVVLLLILFLVCCLYMLVDIKARFDFTVDALRVKEDVLHRVQNIVLKEFDYYVPTSEVMIRIEEERISKQTKESK